MPRDRALKPYRILVYLVYGIACAVLFVQLLRSVVGDLYGRRPPDVAQENPLSCLDELEHIYAELSARAVQPAPRGLESDALARESVDDAHDESSEDGRPDRMDTAAGER